MLFSGDYKSITLDHIEIRIYGDTDKFRYTVCRVIEAESSHILVSRVSEVSTDKKQYTFDIGDSRLIKLQCLNDKLCVVEQDDGSIALYNIHTRITTEIERYVDKSVVITEHSLIVMDNRLLNNNKNYDISIRYFNNDRKIVSKLPNNILQEGISRNMCYIPSSLVEKDNKIHISGIYSQHKLLNNTDKQLKTFDLEIEGFGTSREVLKYDYY
jgi:hypothetical protein